MDTSGDIKLGVGGNIFNSWSSSDKKCVAYAYAYLNPNVVYTYSFGGKSSSTTATATMELKAFPLNDGGASPDYFMLGGFAYNTKDYAATYVNGLLTENTAATGNNGGEITYKNSLFASPAKVSATETFSGKNLEQLRAETWAERGNLANEVVDKAGTDLMWIDIATTPALFRGPYYAQASWQDSNELYAGQFFETESLGFSGAQVTIQASKPYTASASLSGNTATAAQSFALTIPAASPAGTMPNMDSYALKGDLTTGSDAATNFNYDGAVGSSLTYSAKSTASASQQTATQTQDLKKAGLTAGLMTSATSNDYANEIISNERTTVNLVGGLATCSLKGSDSATAKTGSASVTQKITQIVGEDIQRAVTTDSNLADYHATAGNTIPAPGLATNTLAGQSTATATMKGASINGKWSAGNAVGSDFQRTATATSQNGALTWNLVDAKPINAGTTKKTYAFTEKAEATATGLKVL